MKKILLLIACVFSFLFINVNAKEKVKVYLFYKEGCPYCESMEEYLNKLKKNADVKGKFEVVKYQVWDENWVPDNEIYEFYQKTAAYKKDEAGAVPYLVIGDKYSVVGYNESLDNEILDALKSAIEDKDYKDVTADIYSGKIEVDLTSLEENNENVENHGDFKAENYSKSSTDVIGIASLVVNVISYCVIIILLTKIWKKI